jgi:hypothetical protein
LIGDFVRESHEVWNRAALAEMKNDKKVKQTQEKYGATENDGRGIKISI